MQIDPFKINGLKFADGSNFNFSDLEYKVDGTEGNDNLFSAGAGINNSPITFINGGKGDDYISGSNIIANGGEGNDYFQIESGSSKISAGAGDDIIQSSVPISSSIEVYAGDGNDSIQIEGGSNFVNGGRGNDQINLYDNGDGGAFGNNVVFAGSGADSIYVGDGNNIIDGGSGDDDISVGAGSKNRVLRRFL